MTPIIARDNLVKLQEPGLDFNFRRFRVGKNDQLNEVTGFGRVIRLLLNVLSFGQVDRNVRDVYNKSIIAVKFADPDAPAAKKMLEVLQKRSFTKGAIASDLNGKDINAIFQQVHPQTEVPKEDEQPSIEDREPDQIPLPAPDPEEAAEVKEDAQDYNRKYAYLLNLDTVPLQVILSKLTDPEDLKNIALTSEKLAAQVKILMVFRITQMIDFTNRFNNEIQRITNGAENLTGQRDDFRSGVYRNFKFDVQKWSDILQNNNQPNFAVRAAQLAQDCRLDLVEALAEYNVKPGYRNVISPENDRPISQININNMINGLDKEGKEMLTQVLEEAKATLRGEMCLEAFFMRVQADEVMLPLSLKEDIDENKTLDGPFIRMFIWNREISNWFQLPYPRAPVGRFIHLDSYIGMRDGDRIVLPYGREGTEDKQIILRCQHFGNMGHIYFEEIAIDGTLNAIQAEDNSIKDAVTKKLEDGYSKALVDYVRNYPPVGL